MLFFRKAFRSAGEPVAITLDAYAANHRALAELKTSGELYDLGSGAIVQVREQHY
jgi:transposase-like protein